MIGVKEFRDKMIITMNDQILFDSGSARITKAGQKTLNRMAKVLKKIQNNQIVVEGHTDATPIRRTAGKYPTNWDLAAARATNVLKHLEKKGKVSPKLLALAGYSCYLPAAANDCATNRKLNRRIEIAVVPLEMDRVASAREKTALSEIAFSLYGHSSQHDFPVAVSVPKNKVSMQRRRSCEGQQKALLPRVEGTAMAGDDVPAVSPSQQPHPFQPGHLRPVPILTMGQIPVTRYRHRK